MRTRTSNDRIRRGKLGGPIVSVSPSGVLPRNGVTCAISDEDAEWDAVLTD